MQIDNLSALKKEADLERVQKEGELADDRVRKLIFKKICQEMLIIQK